LDICKKSSTFASFFAKRRRLNGFFRLKSFKIMKKMLLIVAVAFAAMSCGNKCCNKCCNQDTVANDTVEVVEAVEVAEDAAL
jgi:hypothetical protein